jgi:hypothetical protein
LTYLFSNGGTFVSGVEGNRLSYKEDNSHNSNINMNLLGDQSQNPEKAFLPLNPALEWIQNRPILKIAPFAQLTSGKLFNNKIEFKNFLDTQRYFSASYSHCFYSPEEEAQWSRNGSKYTDDDSAQSIMLFETGRELVAVWDNKNSIGYIVPSQRNK